MSEVMIKIDNLTKCFPLQEGVLFKPRRLEIKAVDEVSIEVKKGEIVGLVGESGSGKSTLARMIIRLLKPTAGSVIIDGVDLANISRRELKKLRSEVAVVFQDPASNLNPRETIEASIMRPMRINGVSQKEAKARAQAVIEEVKMDASYLKSYPHQLSGGQLQRIAVARALALKPKLMILDEPTSALDISVQAQVLNLLLDLQEEYKLTYLVITHDLNVIRYISDKLAVMYLGQIVEYGPAEEVIKNPWHPYTIGLMAAAPIMDPRLRGTKVPLLGGEPGSLIDIAAGCRLASRCPQAMEACKSSAPKLEKAGPEHYVSCHLIHA